MTQLGNLRLSRKKKMLVIALVLVVMTPSNFVAAHSGRTDSRGGHRDRKNGGYHFHNSGYSYRSSTRNSYSNKLRKSLELKLRNAKGYRKSTRSPKASKKTSRSRSYWFPSVEYAGEEICYSTKSDPQGEFKIVLLTDELVPREALCLIAEQIGKDKVSFFLEAMDHKESPYAICRRANGQYIARYDFNRVAFDKPISFQAEVTEVRSGNRITVVFDSKKIEILLWGVVAPSSGKRFFEESRRYLEDFCLGKKVNILLQEQNSEGEMVSSVSCDNQDLNRKMVEDGFAAAKDGPPGIRDLQLKAQESSVGLWAKVR